MLLNKLEKGEKDLHEEEVKEKKKIYQLCAEYAI